MAQTTAVITTVMNTVASENTKALLAFIVLGLLFLAALQIVIVSASLYFSSLKQPSFEQPDNAWLDLAEVLSIANPDVFLARASFLRQKATLLEFKLQQDDFLKEALENLARAAEIRPLWPYYSLAELNILVLQDAAAERVQEKVAHIIKLAPNERGLDKHLLELAFHSWDKLSSEQQQWMLTRLAIVPSGTLKYVYSVAKSLNHKTVICTNLPYRKIKNLCKAN
jgi:hypothetical protein